MISIIIPIYNVSEYISDCLKSVFAQSYRDYELILVDDCGTDDSIMMAENMIANDTRCSIVHHERNRGLSAARNTGLSIARGKYVFFMDSDDTIEPNCLEILVSVAEHTQADMSIGNVNVIGDNANIPVLHAKHTQVLSGNKNILNSYIKGNIYVMAWNKLVRKDFLIKNGISFVEGLIHEDNPWSFDVACNANKIAFVPDKTYNYLVRENSLQTGKDFTKHFNAYIDIMRILSDTITKKGIVEQTHSWFERQKALFFAIVMENGSAHQRKEMYALIHRLIPSYSLSKANLHYYFPVCIGYHFYKKFYGYNLC